MKLDLHNKIHRKIYSNDKLYGTATMGARGQVVIPAQARKDLKLKPGDQLMVMGKFGKLLGLIKSEQLSELVETIMQHLSGSGMESDFIKYFEKTFGIRPERKRK